MYKFIDQSVVKQQIEMDEWYKQAVERYSLPENITVVQDIPYQEDSLDSHKMDIYYPAKHADKLPVIFDFHGGGLLLCNRKFNQWFCGSMAERGFLVFCIDYPLVPESDVYGILRDSYAGIRKAYDLIETYGGDKEQISLCGDSAGGFIAAYLSAAQNNPKLAASLGITLIDLKIKALAAISGMFYSSRIDKQGIFVLRKYFYGKKYKAHPFWQYVNPENPGIIDHLPPVFCVTAKGDYLKEYTLNFVHALQKAGKKVILQNYDKHSELKHDFVCLRPDCKQSRETMDKMADFLNQCCRK